MCGFLVVCDPHTDIEVFTNSFERTAYRGPDKSNIEVIPHKGIIGFHRLAIMDLSPHGQQPFITNHESLYTVCNGEIFNFKKLKDDLKSSFEFLSDSDCEILLPLYEKHGLEKMVNMLDGEFSFVIFDKNINQFIAARDPIGIRPMFYGFNKTSGKICFASEAKSLLDFCEDIKQFPPGHYYKDNKFTAYLDYNMYSNKSTWIKPSEQEISANIHDLLVEGVHKRIKSDAPIGFLLSGGLDSSLVCAIAAKASKQPIKTFAVGITDNPIDTKYAKTVADYIGSDHKEYLFTKKQAEETLDELIYILETWDITTVRASLGMYLICKFIQETTDIKVLLTGEVSDEIFGYKYTDYAPSPEAFQDEAIKRVIELHEYDVLRADRSISSNKLEARVPFGDKEFVAYVMSLDPNIKMNTSGVGKNLLRKAFKGKGLLPDDILYREKAAFSDAVGHSMVDWLKEFAEKKYTDLEFNEKSAQYKHGTPFTKESLMYREIFEKHYSGKAKLIRDFWMPNKEWDNCNVKDPSARVLPNYGESGN